MSFKVLNTAYKEIKERNAYLNVLKWILLTVGFTEVCEIIYAKLKSKESRLMRRNHSIAFRHRLALGIGERKGIHVTYRILQEQDEVSGILGKNRLQEYSQLLCGDDVSFVQSAVWIPL